jgi:hypothetical protein
MTVSQKNLWWRWPVLVALVIIVGGLVGFGIYQLQERARLNRQLIIVIPAGTAVEIETTGQSDSVPHRIELVLGVQDILVIENEDTVWHTVGPYIIAPGQTLVHHYTQPGTIQQNCTITPSGSIEIVIMEPG